MPRKKKNSRSSNLKGRVITVKGNFIVAPTLTTGFGSTLLNPSNFGTRLAGISDAFNLYRFVHLHVEMSPPVSSAGTYGDLFAMGYHNALVDVVLDTTPEIIEQDFSDYTFSYTALLYPPPLPKMASITVPRSYLLGESHAKWYKTRASSAVEGWEENQGNIVYGGGNATSCFMKVVFECELADWMPPAHTPALVKTCSTQNGELKVESDVNIALSPEVSKVTSNGGSEKRFCPYCGKSVDVLCSCNREVT